MNHDEYILQCQFVETLRLNGFFVFSIVNEGVKNIKTAILHKKQGLLAGTPDLCVLCQDKTIFVEMKSEKGKQNENQKLFEKKATQLGHLYYVIRDWQGCMDFISKFKSCVR